MKRRRVVDAVTGHGDDASLGLETLDFLGLLVGKHFGAYLIQPEPARDGLGRRAVVAGEHDDAKTLFPQVVDRAGCRIFERIRDPEQAGRMAVDRNENHRLAVSVQGLGTFTGCSGGNPQRLEQRLGSR